MINELMPKIHSFLQYRLKKCLILMMMFRNIVLKQDLINDKKGLVSLPDIICCVLWHGPVMEFILYLHCMYINNNKCMLST